MDKTVLQKLDELYRMPSANLRRRWADLMGSDGGRFSRKYMIRRLAYRIQEMAYGGLSRDARRQLKEIAGGSRKAASARKPRRSDLTPGTRLIREWRGDQYEVVVAAEGFLYGGRPYKSLTAVARAITGAAWNGNLFFGLSPRKSRK